MTVPHTEQGERRWTLHKQTGQWDDVIEGPDADGLRVAPVDELSVLRAENAHLRRFVEATAREHCHCELEKTRPCSVCRARGQVVANG